MEPSIDTVRELGQKHSNWGRWGTEDEKGTLNLVTEEMIVAAAGLVRQGKSISMALPYDDAGPQTGNLGRFNPIHLMIRDGADIVSGTSLRDFYGGVEKHFRGTDDLIIMPLQSGTQWDAFGHVAFEGKMYNGFSADWVSSKGALKGDVANASDAMVGRGVLLDIPRALGVDWLEPGHAIGASDLDTAVEHAGVDVGPGDFVFVRTGAMTSARAAGTWGTYAGGDAPGLGIDSVDWIGDRDIAALAADTWGLEVRPNETPDVFQPLHLILIVHMGLWLGEIFDLDPIAADCSADGVYEFMFCGPPLPFTRAVGSPLNPMAIK
ncbi:MAG TPA: cyclase family protein [Acidimicrobiia bacterium]|nr:cyclase family protein [Acidimicrobiia bacterium]